MLSCREVAGMSVKLENGHIYDKKPFKCKYDMYIVYLILFIALHAARASEIHDKGQERVLINEFLTL